MNDMKNWLKAISVTIICFAILGLISYVCSFYKEWIDKAIPIIILIFGIAAVSWIVKTKFFDN